MRFLLESRRRIVQKRVDGIEGDVQAFVGRQSDAGAGRTRVRVGVVPRRSNGQLLVEHDAARKLAQIGFRERGPEQRLIRTLFKLLIGVTQAAFQVESLIRVLQQGQADTSTVHLLQIESLGEIVVERGLPEAVEARRKVFVLLGVGVIDRGFERGCLRLRHRAVRYTDVRGGAIPGVQPILRRDGPEQADGAGESPAVLGRLNQARAGGDVAGPRLEKAGIVAHDLLERVLIDDVGGIADGYRLRRSRAHFNFLIRDRDGSLRNRGLVRFVDFCILRNHGVPLRGVKLLDFAPIHADFSEHVALERHRSAGGTDEMAHEFIAVRENEDVGLRLGSLGSQSGEGQPCDQASQSRKCARCDDFHANLPV